MSRTLSIGKVHGLMRFLFGTATAVALLTSGSAEALSGTVTGTILFNDARDEDQKCDGVAGCIFTDMGSNAGVPAIRVLLLGGFGQQIGEAQTTQSGTYSIAWNDPLLTSFPSSGYKIRVIAENLDDWRVTDPDGATYAWTGSTSITSSNQNVGSRSLGGDESANVFVTAFNFWEQVVNVSSTLSARMTSVAITANAIPGSPGANFCPGSCALTRDDVVIEDTDGFNFPISSVAHELGHSATMHALDIDLLYVYPAGCAFVAHNFAGEHPCEKVAWHEGIANLWATVTMWSKNTADGSARMGSVGFPVGDPLEECLIDAEPAKWEACHAAALWDFYDDPAGDDDPVDDSATNIAASSIVNILDQYTNGSADRHNAESGDHGSNHWDFLENVDDLFSETLESHLRSIYNATELCDDGEEPYGSC